MLYFDNLENNEMLPVHGDALEKALGPYYGAKRQGPVALGLLVQGGTLAQVHFPLHNLYTLAHQWGAGFCMS